MSLSPRHPSRRAGCVLIACAALAAIVLGACSSTTDDSSDSGGKSVTIQTAAGPLTLHKTAKKIAVLQFQPLEDLLSIGVQPTMVADEQQPGSGTPMPPQFKGKLGKYTSLGNRIAPSLEVLASQPVDLIIADKTEHLKDYKQLSKIAPTMILDTSSWADFFPNLEKIGAATGKVTQAAAVEKSIKGVFASAKAKLQQASSTRALVGVPTPDKFFAFTANSPQAGVMTEMGLTYAYKQIPGQLSVQVPLEALAPTKPDVVFLTAFPKDPKVTDSWKGNPLWDGMPAVSANKVFLVDRGIWSLGRGAISIPLMVQQTLSSLAVS
jgi:ferric citrate transport system substrate-binding protein